MPDLDFYFAYNGFRIAATLQGIVGRVRDGQVPSADAASAEQRIGPLARFAADRARTAGMRR